MEYGRNTYCAKHCNNFTTYFSSVKFQATNKHIIKW